LQIREEKTLHANRKFRVSTVKLQLLFLLFKASNVEKDSFLRRTIKNLARRACIENVELNLEETGIRLG